MERKLEKSFLEGLEQNKDKLFRICCNYATNPDDSKDLFQEVLINIWQSIPSFKSNSAIGTWMFRITLNVCLRLQSTKKKQKALFRNMDSVTLENLSIAPQNEEQTVQLQQLRNCIKNLEEADKSIVSLYLEELSYKEISEITGLTENHIAVKIKRIKSKLYKCMG